MRKALYFILPMALAGGLFWMWSQNRAAPSAPNSASDTPLRPVEEVYAPAKLLRAGLSDDGLLKLSGSATPKSILTVMDGNQTLVTVRLGNSPQWALEAKLPPARIRRRVVTLSLSSRLPDDTIIRSEENLIILAEPEKFAQALLLTTPGAATRVPVPPGGAVPGSKGLLVEAADYDDGGGIIFSGTTNTPGRIRLRAGGTLIGETGPNASGRWTLISGSAVPVGRYIVTVQGVGEDGDVQSEVNLPFTRLEPGAPAAISDDLPGAQADAQKAPLEARALFEPQSWTLSRPLTGGGVQHTVIWKAPEATP